MYVSRYLEALYLYFVSISFLRHDSTIKLYDIHDITAINRVTQYNYIVPISLTYVQHMSRIHHYVHVHLQGLQLGELKKELLSNKHNETETPLRITEERLVLRGKINDVKTVRR